MSNKKMTENSQLAATARMFSSVVVQELARQGRSRTFARLLGESALHEVVSGSAPLSAFFESAFALLTRKNFRYEYAYRAAVTHKILLGIHSLNTASMLSEFRIGTCKADLVILNGASTVYEIKSERDNLDRLPNQIAAYFKVFSRVNIITSENHIDAVLDSVPDDVGVLLLNSRLKISPVREAQDRLTDLCPLTLLDSLHRNEAFEILKSFGVPIPDVPNTRIHSELATIFSRLPPHKLHECMIRILKETRSLLPLSELARALPKSLKPLAFSSSIRERDHERLIASLSTPVAEALTWA
ncbi:sce7726 family protein [Janthinobacterium sp.]|uniref:sce7726 family protein n=1 Tax=Janthinobacterium sp. TaxID=1871054 RepID=UPI0028987016|nr:sce7726 family protein [Janthinobacterium sp.]